MNPLSPGNRATALIEQGGQRLTVRLNSYSGHGFWTAVDDAYNVYTIHENNLMAIQTIPSRFQYRNFERVAHIIGKALTNYPNVIEVDTTPLSLETYARLLREARDGKKKYGHKHPLVDESMFKEFIDKIEFAIDEGKLLVGPREKIKQAKAVGTMKATQTMVEAQPETLVSPEPLCLESLCQLLSKRAFDPTPNFVVVGPTRQTIEYLESIYDVVFSQFANDPTKYEIR